MRFMLIFLGALAVHCAATAACPPNGVTRSEILDLQASKGELADHAKRQRLAIGLAGCLADPDPMMRETASAAIAT